MQRHAEQRAATARVDAAGSGAASTTTRRDGGGSVQRRGGGDGMELFGDLSPALRLQLQLVAAQSATADEALEDAIALLVPGTAAKQAAIVGAFRDTEPLRDQWQRAWHALRA